MNNGICKTCIHKKNCLTAKPKGIKILSCSDHIKEKKSKKKKVYIVVKMQHGWDKEIFAVYDNLKSAEKLIKRESKAWFISTFISYEIIDREVMK